MRTSRLFLILFGGSLAVLIVLLGYGGVLTYRTEYSRVQEDVNRTVQKTADTVQHKNYPKYDVVRAFSDKMINQKIAFAAGMTQNQKLMSFDFDNKADADPEEPKDPAQGKVITLYPKGQKPIKIVVPQNKKADTGKYVPAGVRGIDYFDSLLSTSLKKEGLVVPYHIEQVKKRLPMVQFSVFIIIDYYNPDLYRVVYTIPRLLMMRRLVPYTSISFFLLALVCGAFLLYYRSYRMNVQTAQFRDSLLSNVTHELKTPVSSLQLIIGALGSSEGNSPEQEQYIAFAGKELARMKTLIEKILSFSKLNERQFALNKEIVDLGGLIDEAMDITQPLIASVGGAIEFERNGTPEVMGDRILLLNLMINLVDNAVKYSTENPLVHISLATEGGVAVVMVRDSGIGIPPQFHKKIFEPFFRVPAGDLYDVPGHGIGLSFVQQTVKLHQGTITVASEQGKGSTFIIRLPAL